MTLNYKEYIEGQCDHIDACVFSGELLWYPECRAVLREYVERWTRALDAHEEAEAAERTGDKGREEGE